MDKRKKSDLHTRIAKACVQVLPDEACGFVVDDLVIACRNIATCPTESFVISAEDYLAHRPKVIYHSHPKGLDGFSDHDLAVAANMELTSYVYVVEDDRLERWTAHEGVVVFREVLQR